MTIGITGPERQAPRRNVVVALFIAAIAAAVSLVLLGLTGAILVDWMWFSAIGYQARDRGLRRKRRHEGNACRDLVGAFHRGWHRTDNAERCSVIAKRWL